MNIVITSAAGDRQALALRLLFARFPVEEQETRCREALQAAARGTLKLDSLVLAEDEGLPVGAALVMLQADGVALVWPPVVSCGATDETAVEDLLMQEICRRIDSTGARLGQCLLTPGDAAESELLYRHGFERAAEMFFLARTLTEIDAGSEENNSNGTGRSRSEEAVTGVSVETYSDENSARFARVVEESYQGSLDCVYLAGFRNGVDAIASHKLSGVFGPDNWALYVVGGRDAGVLLLNDHPDQDAVELVYLGVTPSERGKGLGRRMIREGLQASARRGRSVMFLAVDCDNSYANDLYREFEFAELARRQILLRRSAGLVRQ